MISKVDQKVKEIKPRLNSNKDRMVGLAFKALNNPKFGPLLYIKVYSGSLKKGKQFFNVNKGISERPLHILRVQGEEHKPVEEIRAGDIAAVAGLSSTRSGDTLVDREEPIPRTLEGVDTPEPVFLSSLELENAKDEKKLYDSLDLLGVEDPSFSYEMDDQTSQLVVKGLGELHLQIMRDRLQTEFRVRTTLSKLRVAYKEAVSAMSELSKEFKERMQGYEQYFNILVAINSNNQEDFNQPLTDKEDESKPSKASGSNLEEGERYSREEDGSVVVYLPGNNVVELAFLKDSVIAQNYNKYRTLRYQEQRGQLVESDEFINYNLIVNTTEEEGHAVQETVNVGQSEAQLNDLSLLEFDLIYKIEEISINSLQRGPSLGRSLLNTRILINGGAFTEKYTSEVMIESCTNRAIFECLTRAGPCLMEPVMDISIFVPEEYTQKVINDFLGTRKGKVLDVLDPELTNNKYDLTTINGVISSESVIGYANVLRGMTKGEASFTAELSGYQRMDDGKANRILRERAKY